MKDTSSLSHTKWECKYQYLHLGFEKTRINRESPQKFSPLRIEFTSKTCEFNSL